MSSTAISTNDGIISSISPPGKRGHPPNGQKVLARGSPKTECPTPLLACPTAGTETQAGAIVARRLSKRLESAAVPAFPINGLAKAENNVIRASLGALLAQKILSYGRRRNGSPRRI
jgi:hypothetical protein